MVVDDDTVCRAVCRKFFGTLGFQVLEASSIAQLAKAMEIKKVHLVLLDQALPDGTGSEFLATVGTRSPETFFLLMTGETDRDRLAVLQDQVRTNPRVNGFWLKPLNPDRIMRVARRVVARDRDPDAPLTPEGRVLLDWQDPPTPPAPPEPPPAPPTEPAAS